MTTLRLKLIGEFREVQNRQTNTKDTFFNQVLESKWFYLLLLVFVYAYMFTDSKVLNLPTGLFWIRYSVCVLLLGWLFIFRKRKYKEYYKRKVRDVIYLVGVITGVLFFSLIFQAVLNIPVNLVIEKYSKQDNYEVYNCEIKRINTIGYDKVTFVFKNKSYSRYYSLAGLEATKITKQYQMKLIVAESIYNTYYLKSLELVRKEE